MKKVIRRTYSSDFSEMASAPVNQIPEQPPRPRKKRLLFKAAIGAAALGAGGYAARNTKVGTAVRGKVSGAYNNFKNRPSKSQAQEMRRNGFGKNDPFAR